MARVERIVSRSGRQKRVFVGEVFPQRNDVSYLFPCNLHEKDNKENISIPRFGNCGNTEGMFWRALRACGWETKKDLVCYKRGRGHDVRRKRIRNTARRRAVRMKKEYLLRQEEERETIEELIA